MYHIEYIHITINKISHCYILVNSKSIIGNVAIAEIHIILIIIHSDLAM